MPDGIDILLSDLQSWKAFFSIYFKEEEIVICANEKQFFNVPSLIETTEEEFIKFFNDLQF